MCNICAPMTKCIKSFFRAICFLHSRRLQLRCRRECNAAYERSADRNENKVLKLTTYHLKQK
ncbi:hypothetical protein M5D96_006091 [Drosophila gunungcola]|uniref:Uncharacterized protein n=1 Tax=Drosophila gunungcola TaxID=103775 RepID=A0A9Q0BRA3_9MUSC|nr:hypothetical protein M5D96_006091 [Drosophila gunungcola]